MSEGGSDSGAPAPGDAGSSAGQPPMTSNDPMPNEGISTSKDTNKRVKYTEVEKTSMPGIHVERAVQRQRERDPYHP
jgi:hypothetical protein